MTPQHRAAKTSRGDGQVVTADDVLEDSLSLIESGGLTFATIMAGSVLAAWVFGTVVMEILEWLLRVWPDTIIRLGSIVFAVNTALVAAETLEVVLCHAVYQALKHKQITFGELYNCFREFYSSKSHMRSVVGLVFVKNYGVAAAFVALAFSLRLVDPRWADFALSEAPLILLSLGVHSTLFVAVPLACTQPGSVLTCLEKAWRLTKGHREMICGVVLMITVLTGFAFLIWKVGEVLTGRECPVRDTVLSALVAPVYAITAAVCYYKILPKRGNPVG